MTGQQGADSPPAGGPSRWTNAKAFIKAHPIEAVLLIGLLALLDVGIRAVFAYLTSETAGEGLRTFMTSPGMGGVAAVIAASIAFFAVFVQVKQSRRAARDEAWWTSFEWTTDRAVPPNPAFKPLPVGLSFDLLTKIKIEAESSFQRQTVDSVIESMTVQHLLEPFDAEESVEEADSSAAKPAPVHPEESQGETSSEPAELSSDGSSGRRPAPPANKESIDKSSRRLKNRRMKTVEQTEFDVALARYVSASDPNSKTMARAQQHVLNHRVRKAIKAVELKGEWRPEEVFDFGDGLLARLSGSSGDFWVSTQSFDEEMYSVINKQGYNTSVVVVGDGRDDILAKEASWRDTSYPVVRLVFDPSKGADPLQLERALEFAAGLA